tara:strand:+ start:5679 stop:6539 length:861 start_codon:yes stop_codon:yes gene_type:complete
MSYMKSRERKFEAWWKKNHHKQAGQVWLCKSAKRIAFAYNLHPSAFDDVRFICKRFFSSEHMRLRKADAWKLYKLCNPLYEERLKRLQTTAEHLDALKREKGDGLQHPLWIGKPKAKQMFGVEPKAPTAHDILQAIKDRPKVKDPNPLSIEELKKHMNAERGKTPALTVGDALNIVRVNNLNREMEFVEERRSKLPKLEYKDYQERYSDGARIGNSHNTTLAKDVLERIDIVDLVHEAIFWGMDNYNAYGEDTKDVINCNSLSTFFRLLQELELSEPPAKENKDVV